MSDFTKMDEIALSTLTASTTPQGFGFKMQKKKIFLTEMGEFQTGIRLFDWSTNSFLYEIWLQ